VIANGGRGYHLREWIIVEQYDDVGTLATVPGSNGTAKIPANRGDSCQPQLSDRQHWVLTQLKTGVQVTRQTVEQQFGISKETAKRDLSELGSLGLIEFDGSVKPGRYRLK
jgi:predicted HTH transcriptional regulator